MQITSKFVRKIERAADLTAFKCSRCLTERFAYAHVLDTYLTAFYGAFSSITATSFERSSIEAVCGQRLLAEHGGPPISLVKQFLVDLHLQCGSDRPEPLEPQPHCPV